MDRLKAVGARTSADESWQVVNSETSAQYLHRAAGLWFSGTTGTVSALINAAQVDVTYATSTTVTAGLMATAINADATAKTFVSAHRRIAKMTSASAIAGDTVTVFGVTFTAQASTATAGTNQWDISTDDTAAGLSLATQINSHLKLVDRCFAVNVAGVVYVGLLQDRYARADEVISSTGGTVTVNNQIIQNPSRTLALVSAIASDVVNVFGYTFTAVSAAVTAGTLGWDIRTSDTAAATSLAAQINAYAPLKRLCYATSAVGVVTVFVLDHNLDVTRIESPDTTVTEATVSAGLNVVAVVAHLPGALGNACSFTASGTNASVSSMVTNKLGGGTGGTAVANIVHSNYR
jgi:hypothetical protein